MNVTKKRQMMSQHALQFDHHAIIFLSSFSACQRSADHVKPLRQLEKVQVPLKYLMEPWVETCRHSIHRAASPRKTLGDQSKSKSLSSLKHAQMPLEERPVTSQVII